MSGRRSPRSGDPPVGVVLAVVGRQQGVPHDQRPAVLLGRLLQPLEQGPPDATASLGNVDAHAEERERHNPVA